MSAGLAGIGPVSVRYAIQIRELLDTQAIKRMAASEEAARAANVAERAARIEAIRNTSTSYEPVKVDVKTDIDAKPADKADAPREMAEPAAPIATVDVASGQFVDELA